MHKNKGGTMKENCEKNCNTVKLPPSCEITEPICPILDNASKTQKIEDIRSRSLPPSCMGGDWRKYRNDN